MPRPKTKNSAPCNVVSPWSTPCTYCRGHHADHRDADGRTWGKAPNRGARPPTPTSAERSSLVFSLWQEGKLSQSEIARETGVSRQRVKQILDAAGCGGDRGLLERLRKMSADAGMTPDAFLDLAGSAAAYREDNAGAPEIVA